MFSETISDTSTKRSTPELTAERSPEVEDIPTKRRTCAAIALVIVARLRQRNVAPDHR